MAWFRRHKKQRPDQVIEARTLRELAETADATSQIQADPPLGIVAGTGGYLLRYIGPIFGAYIAVVNSGGISARSGSTPGSGQVTLQTWNGTSLAAMTGPGATWPVKNWNSASGGVASGKYCVILKIYGVYWVINAEC
jgi:hypothetical protein